MSIDAYLGTRDGVGDADADAELERMRLEWAGKRRRAWLPSAFDGLTDEEQRQLVADAFDDDGVLL